MTLSDHQFQMPLFANLREPVRITGHSLPHWYQPGRTLFSTFRLAASLPGCVADAYQSLKAEWQRLYPLPWDNATKDDFAEATGQWMEQWLHRCHDNSILTDGDVRRIVDEAFRHNDGIAVVIYAYVIMPNHVHILYAMADEDITPEAFIGGVKRYTARMINRRLSTSGSVWQKGCFDRLVRNAAAFRRNLEYIIDNPRHLSPGQYSLYVHPVLLEELRKLQAEE